MELLWMTIAGLLAFALGRNVIIWGFLGYALGWPVIIGAILFPANIKKSEERIAKINSMTERMHDRQQSATVNKEIKDFDTVDDLFKQLDKK